MQRRGRRGIGRHGFRLRLRRGGRAAIGPHQRHAHRPRPGELPELKPAAPPARHGRVGLFIREGVAQRVALNAAILLVAVPDEAVQLKRAQRRVRNNSGGRELLPRAAVAHGRFARHDRAHVKAAAGQGLHFILNKGHGKGFSKRIEKKRKGRAT